MFWSVIKDMILTLWRWIYVIQHEAGHFLIAYLLGVLPKGYTLSSLKALIKERSLNVQAGTAFVDFEFIEEVWHSFPVSFLVCLHCYYLALHGSTMLARALQTWCISLVSSFVLLNLVSHSSMLSCLHKCAPRKDAFAIFGWMFLAC